MKIAIVTDDLTSATDGAVAFAEAGWSVKVARGLPVGVPIQAELLSIDTASRASAVSDAVRRVRAAGAAVARAPRVVKQFDSTLRGHVAAETLALLRTTGRRRVIVAPAFPAAGRTTIEGRQFVNGVPVHESAYARDPLNPVECSDVCALFEREGVEVGRSSNGSAPVIVLDSKTESDLDRIVAEYGDHEDTILAGSTGLMRALARHHRSELYACRAIIKPSRRVLIVVGSLNVQSREQLDGARRASVPVFTLSATDNPAVIADCIGLQFDTTRSVALTTLEEQGNSRSLAGVLSRAVVQLVERAAIDALVVTGGETLATILDRLGTRSLTVYREIEPGIPLCVLDEPCSLPLVSKAGGFGSPGIFLKALEALF